MIENEALEFQMKLKTRAAHARQRAAMRLACGIDFDSAIAAQEPERARLCGLVERRLKRERLKGLNRHWSYDLNRHIALKQVLDALRAPASEMKKAAEAALIK